MTVAARQPRRKRHNHPGAFLSPAVSRCCCMLKGVRESANYGATAVKVTLSGKAPLMCSSNSASECLSPSFAALALRRGVDQLLRVTQRLDDSQLVLPRFHKPAVDSTRRRTFNVCRSMSWQPRGVCVTSVFRRPISSPGPAGGAKKWERSREYFEAIAAAKHGLWTRGCQSCPPRRKR